jgi:UDP-N-acetylmuramoyl-tripeptide--D-alanyl-D-alanine ligase
VGDQGLAFHLEVLRHATARGLRSVHVAGTHMANATLALGAGGEPSARHWCDVDSLAAAMASVVTCTEHPVRSILVKGSRFMRMERVVQAIAALDPASSNPKDPSHAA